MAKNFLLEDSLLSPPPNRGHRYCYYDIYTSTNIVEVAVVPAVGPRIMQYVAGVAPSRSVPGGEVPHSLSTPTRSLPYYGRRQLLGPYFCAVVLAGLGPTAVGPQIQSIPIYAVQQGVDP